MADHLASSGTLFEPQRQHNWAIELGLSNDNDVVTLSVVTGFLPTGYNDEVPLPYGNEEVYIAGKARWDAGRLICRDWIDRPTAALLLGWRQSVYSPFTGAINLARQYKRNASLILFAPNVVSGASFPGNEFTREWILQGVWPVRVNPAQNGLDMTTSGTVMIEMDLRFDKAFANFPLEQQGLPF